MFNNHGSQVSCSEEALQRSCFEGVRGYPGHHEDSFDWSEVRQQLHASQNHLVESTVSSVSQRSGRFRHRAFGLCIDSNLPLPGLPSSLETDPADICVHLAHEHLSTPVELLYRSPNLDEAGEPILLVWGTCCQAYRFDYCDGTRFWITATGSEVYSTWPSGLTADDTVVYLYGPILGFILRLRGIVSLHASGVLLDDRAIALIGAPGAGKSTTAAAFVRAGYRAITDDVFAILDSPQGFLVQPAYPGIRLWPESVRDLWGSPDALPRLTMGWEKRYLNLQDESYSADSRPLPVTAAYFLAERVEDPRAPYLDAEPPSVLDLLANTYAGYALNPQMRAHEFDVLTRFANSVPARRLVPHSDAARLPELCRLIEEDLSARAVK